MKKVTCFLVLSVLLGCVCEIQARNLNSSNESGYFSTFSKRQSNATIKSAVQSYINKNSSGVEKVKITQSDVQGVWALVWAKSQDKNLDEVQLLLHKQRNKWKVLVMGTSLNGTGKQYKVPNNLRKKWNL